MYQRLRFFLVYLFIPTTPPKPLTAPPTAKLAIASGENEILLNPSQPVTCPF